VCMRQSYSSLKNSSSCISKKGVAKGDSLFGILAVFYPHSPP
jgi:hypothetical protein